MKEHLIAVSKKGRQGTADFVTQVTTVVSNTTNGVDTYIAPVRSGILKRFPVLFSLLVPVGASTTFLGFEKLISHVTFLENNPLLLLILGMGILAFTGTLYKKLS